LSRGKRKGKSRGKGKGKKNKGHYKNIELALILVKKAELLIDTKDLDGALKDLQLAIEKDPSYARVRLASRVLCRN
jgi:hypothetical protein